MKYLQTFVIGCIAVLGLHLVPHIGESFVASIIGIVTFVVVVWFAKKVGEHFSHGHTHEGDSELDSSIGITLLVVNVLHPMVDGFVLYEIYTSEHAYVLVSIGIGVLIHELFRQSALVVIFKQFGFAAWKVIVPAIVGLGTGIVIGRLGGNLPSQFEPYIDVATCSAYTFIVAEYIFGHVGIIKKRNHIIVGILGVCTALIFMYFFEGH